MNIEYIKIQNFRGLDIEIDSLKKCFLIIGRNSVGKSNVCYAIRKILDPLVRRIPFTEDDSTNHNKEEILISMKLNLDNLKSVNRSQIGKYVDMEDDGSEYLYIEFSAQYNEDIYLYDEQITLGLNDKTPFSTSRSIPLDYVLDLIYIEPNYNYEKSLNSFFKFKKKQNEEDGKAINNDVLVQTQKLNETISNDALIESMSSDINLEGEFDSVFDDVSFKIASKMDISDVYKLLDIQFIDSIGQNICELGDGKLKVLSMLLKLASYDETKEKIFIIEEPENHMYPLLQKTYAKLIDKFTQSQCIFTSHSPYIFDLEKMNQIIRLTRKNNKTEYKSINITEDTYKTFGYMLNEEIGEIIFHDKVLLVEGFSEKYFYNILYYNDESFREYCIKEKLGIYNVIGVDFAPILKFLSSLGIEVFIKTDNDLFKVPKQNPEQYRFAGLERALRILGREDVKFDIFRYHTKNDINYKKIEDKMDDIQNYLFNNKILMSKHHEGFERDFLEFIGIEEDNEYFETITNLQKSKLKNLHEYIYNNIDKIKINDKNKNSILVRFMNEY